MTEIAHRPTDEITEDDITAALEKIFSVCSERYRGRGFLKRIGYGTRPALLNIDLGNIWTRPDRPGSCDDMDVIIPGVQRLLASARARRIPIIFTTVGFAVTEGPYSDAGLYLEKMPAHHYKLDSEDIAIDDRVAPQSGEQLIVKKRASAFHGTYLSSFLKAADVDTLIVTGVTASGCVRHTVEDAIAEGFRPIVVRECIGDRIPGAVQWNLFDIDAKFGDVEPLEAVIEYLDNLAPVAR